MAVELEGGKNLTVYTGPKNGKFIIRKGKKVYVDKKTYNDNIPYTKVKKGKKANKTA